MPELPQAQLQRLDFLDLNGKDLALDRARTETLTYGLGKQLRIPVVSGSDTHQAVQYGCVTTVLERTCTSLSALREEMEAGRYEIQLSDTAAAQVRTACPFEALPQGDPRPGRGLRLYSHQRRHRIDASRRQNFRRTLWNCVWMCPPGS